MSSPRLSLWARRSACAGLAILAALSFLGARTAQPNHFAFGVIGDAPYRPEEVVRFAAAINAMNQSELAFVVHVGDIQADGRSAYRGGIPTCADESLLERKKLFDASRHPFILTPGDNDWTDCHGVKDRVVDPLERLARLRTMFFPTSQSLGQRKITLAIQSVDPRYAKYVENRSWIHEGVHFVTLHIVGSNNNRGRNPQMDAEYAERNAANLAWMVHAFERARSGQARAIVIVIQANPFFERTWAASQVKSYLPGLPVDMSQPVQPTGFDDFLAALEREVPAFPKPVLLVHGDTHLFRLDKPLVRKSDQRLIEHFTRLETFGSPDVHWVRVVVNPKEPAVFSVTPQIVSGR